MLINVLLIALIMGAGLLLTKYHLIVDQLGKDLKSLDVSMYRKPTDKAVSDEQAVWLISYADGDEFYQSRIYALMHSALGKDIDHILTYKREHIEPEFYQAHKAILDEKRGAGYWLWKPYFIYKTLKMMAEGDYLIYVDASFVVRGPVKPLIDLAEQHGMVFFSSENYSNKGYVKREAIEFFGVDYEQFKDSKQIAGGILVFKNTPQTRQKVEEWFSYAKRPELLTDQGSRVDEYHDFVDHRHEQSILNLMQFKQPFGHVVMADSSQGIYHPSLTLHHPYNFKSWPSSFVAHPVFFEQKTRLQKKFYKIYREWIEVHYKTEFLQP